MAEAFDGNTYCNFDATTTKAKAGADVLFAIFDQTGSNLLAVGGQKGLTINRSAESIDVSSKDTKGGWMSKISGMKEWSIDNDGVYVASDKAHVELGRAFEESEPVCVKIVDRKTKKGMFGGLAFITEYTLEAPYEEAMTYSITLEGNGALSDISDLSSGTQPTPGGGEA